MDTAVVGSSSSSVSPPSRTLHGGEIIIILCAPSLTDTAVVGSSSSSVPPPSRTLHSGGIILIICAPSLTDTAQWWDHPHHLCPLPHGHCTVVGSSSSSVPPPSRTLHGGGIILIICAPSLTDTAQWWDHPHHLCPLPHGHCTVVGSSSSSVPPPSRTLHGGEIIIILCAPSLTDTARW
ncbi:hypothetical protein ACOMHN_010841 [Nucella lapillus]